MFLLFATPHDNSNRGRKAHYNSAVFPATRLSHPYDSNYPAGWLINSVPYILLRPPDAGICRALFVQVKFHDWKHRALVLKNVKILLNKIILTHQGVISHWLQYSLYHYSILLHPLAHHSESNWCKSKLIHRALNKERTKQRVNWINR